MINDTTMRCIVIHICKNFHIFISIIFIIVSPTLHSFCILMSHIRLMRYIVNNLMRHIMMSVSKVKHLFNNLCNLTLLWSYLSFRHPHQLNYLSWLECLVNPSTTIPPHKPNLKCSYSININPFAHPLR